MAVRSVGLAALMLAGALLSACFMGLPERGAVRAAPGERLALGVIAPRTGALAAEGEGIVNAVRLAIERHGMISGRSVELLAHDDGCEPARTAAATRSLLTDERLLGVVGPACSPSCVTAGNLLYERGTVMVTPRCTDAAVTRQGAEGVFRTTWTDAFEASAAARFARFNLDAERAFVVHDGTVYARNLRDFYRALWGEDNLEGVSELRQGSDPGSVVRTIARSQARSIHYFGFGTGAAAFLRELRAANITVPVMLPEAALLDGFVSQAGAAGEGVRITRVLSPPPPPLSAFGRLYHARYGMPPPPFAAEAYDAALAILEAASETAEQAGGEVRLDRRELRDAVYRTDLIGVTGRLRFRLNGDRLQGARVEVLRVEQGALVHERTLILPE